MRNSTRALFNGDTSYILAGAWAKDSSFHPLEAGRRRLTIETILIAAGCLYILASAIPLPWNSLVIWMLCGAAGILVLIAVATFMLHAEGWGSIEIRFTEDCYQLKRCLGQKECLAKFSYFELKDVCEKQLTSLAGDLLASEKAWGNGSSHTEEMRDRFKASHAIMLRFGFVEESWDSYFKKAEQQVKS